MARPALLAALLTLALAPVAHAASQADSVAPVVVPPPSQTQPPPGFTTSARQAIAIAKRQPLVQKAYRKQPDLKVFAWVWQGVRWEIDFNRPDGVNEVEVDVLPDGTVTGAWSGLQARAYFTRGHFGRKFDNPAVWLVFGVLFLLPFVDRRRPLRMLHLDMLVLLGFGVSYAFFDNAHVRAGVWLVYPVLLYLTARMLWIGSGRGRTRAPAVHLPTAALLVGVVALFAGRVVLNVVNDKVIDVGYASVVGADRLAHGQQLYVDNDVHGDTYGPVNYVAYIPFEAVFPWHGKWDHVPAAHAATMTFDLLTIVCLVLLGMRMRAGPEGRRLGLALAWAWAAFPFTLFGVMQNTNDGLVALLFVASLLLTSRIARGATLGLAAAAKFVPGAVVPVYMHASRRLSWKLPAAALAVFVVAFAPFIPDAGLRAVWNCTLGYQLGRPPDFSLWGIVDGIGWTQKLLEAAAIALALLLAVFPRGRRSLVQVAALAAAVTIAIQIPAGHWFYFYVMWFTPFALVALLAPDHEPGAA